ncbi:MAG: glycosyltransferase, partial [Planctomycetales bacterium]|nr:glycosyltransferase [Planctomycetales bacterium]
MSDRILHIVPSLEYSGFGSQLRCLCAALADREPRMAVLSLRGHGPLAAELTALGVHVESLPTQPGQAMRWPATVLRLLKKFAPDTIHTWTDNANLIGRLIGLWGRVPRIIASFDSPQKAALLLESGAQRSLNRWTDAFLIHSDLDSLDLSKVSLPMDRTYRVPTAISRETVERARANAGRERQRWIEQLGLPSDCRIIVTVGPLQRSKRIKDLCWAMDLLRHVCEKSVLLIVGDGPHRWRLERYGRQVEADGRIHFLGAQPNVLNLMAASDCVWLAGAPRWSS